MPNWLNILLHILVVSGGAAGVYLGHPNAAVAGQALNALIPSPLQRGTGVAPKQQTRP